MNKMEPISFRKLIPKNQSDTLTYEITADGTVEQVNMRFYTGQQLSLQVRAYVLHKNERQEPLIKQAKGSKPFVCGNDDRFDFPCVVPVEQFDKLIVEVTNTDVANDYDLVVDIFVDYYGGTNRVV